MNSSTSCSDTDGPRSFISVCWPVVGSSTEVLVRDSSRMRTKSLRIASSVSCSTMCVPVAPPAKPVAITGWPSAFSVRAMFTPLPPAIVRCSTVRWRLPSWKFGTESDLSIAALSVTVMIIVALYPPSCALSGGALPQRAPKASGIPRAGRWADRPGALPGPSRPALTIHQQAAFATRSEMAQAASRSRSASARAAAAGSLSARLMGVCDAARRGQKPARAPGEERRLEILHPPPLRADTREQEDRMRHQLARPGEMIGCRGPHHRPHVAQPRVTDGSAPERVHDHGNPLPHGAALLEPQVLDVRGARVGRAHEHEHTGAPISRGGHERLDRRPRPSAGSP